MRTIALFTGEGDIPDDGNAKFEQVYSDAVSRRMRDAADSPARIQRREWRLENHLQALPDTPMLGFRPAAIMQVMAGLAIDAECRHSNQIEFSFFTEAGVSRGQFSFSLGFSINREDRRGDDDRSPDPGRRTRKMAEHQITEQGRPDQTHIVQRREQ